MKTNFMTRAISFLFIALLAATMLPAGLFALTKTANASAQANVSELSQEPTKSNIINTITITNAEITPIIDMKIKDCLDYDLPEGANYTVDGHYWFCDTDITATANWDVFLEGKTYFAFWKFMAADGYEFSEATVVTINGTSSVLNMENTAIGKDTTTIFWVETLPTAAVTAAAIDSIAITNANITPIIGNMAGANLYYELHPNANFTEQYHYWYCDTDNEEMHSSDVFEAGKEYSLRWRFRTIAGYEFSDNTVVTINGSSDIVDTNSAEMNDDNARMLWVWSTKAEAVEESAFELGDVTMDGVVNTGDAVTVLRQSVGLITFSNEQNMLGDYNKDRKVNTGDAVSILRFCVGLKDNAQLALYAMSITD